MDAGKLVIALALMLVSACQRNEAISVREIAPDSPMATTAMRMMHRDNPDTFVHRKFLEKIYYIETKLNDCVWFVYDARVGFNDSEFLYCKKKDEIGFRRL